MNCFYHQITLANTRCRTCARPLCPACDHRVKGFTYCQDCIVAGIERINGNSQGIQPGEKTPGLAALLSLIPGLGSAYNGLIIKALVYFAVTVGLWELHDLFDSSMFWWGGMAFYVYSIFNAYQDAKRINAGEDLSPEEEKLKRILHEKTAVWGTGLIGIGVLTILRWVLPNPFVAKLWPVLLIAFGVYLLFMYKRDKTKKITNQLAQDFPPQIPQANSYDPIIQDYSQAETRRFDVR